jgi:hypothetical protein
MSARFRHGQWSEHVRLAKHNVQMMNDATEAGARDLAASPTFVRQLELASAVLSLNEAMVLVAGIVAWGMAAKEMVDRGGCGRSDNPRERLLVAVRRLMRHRKLTTTCGEHEWNHVTTWTREHVDPLMRAPSTLDVGDFESLVWDEVLGIRRLDAIPER